MKNGELYNKRENYKASGKWITSLIFKSSSTIPTPTTKRNLIVIFTQKGNPVTSL